MDSTVYTGGVGGLLNKKPVLFFFVRCQFIRTVCAFVSIVSLRKFWWLIFFFRVGFFRLFRVLLEPSSDRRYIIRISEKTSIKYTQFCALTRSLVYHQLYVLVYAFFTVLLVFNVLCHIYKFTLELVDSLCQVDFVSFCSFFVLSIFGDKEKSVDRKIRKLCFLIILKNNIMYTW